MTAVDVPVNPFSTVLASSIHDIKTSLTTIRELIDQLAQIDSLPKTPAFRQLEFEASRMNSSLVQLLIFYKIDAALFAPVIDEYQVKEIVDDVAAQQSSLLSLSAIDLINECPDDLYCYCDASLIATVLVSIVNNAQRYCRKTIVLSAFSVDDTVCFQVEDDGDGYPDELLTKSPLLPIASEASNTGLGLFFAATIAKLHTNGNQPGYVQIDNDSRYRGARFRLFLP